MSFVAQSALPYDPSFPYAEAILLNRDLPQWLASWANFDGVHYLTIVDRGYVGTGLIQAFFPVYPGLIWLLSLLHIDSLLAGMVITHLSFIALLVALHSYFSQQKNTNALILLLVLLTFPTSFFFGAVYTEALFMLLVLTSLWAAEKKQWILAGLLAAIASGTRLVGIFLLAGIALEVLQQQQILVKEYVTKFRQTTTRLASTLKKRPQILAGLSIAPLGLVIYMMYLAVEFNDPLYFYHVQSEFGGGRQESLILLPQVIWRYVKILLTYRPFDLKYLSFIQELLFTAGAYLALYLGRNKVRWSWTGFSLLAITLPTLTGTFSSMPRYVLVALPIFVVITSFVQTSRWKTITWLTVSSCILAFNTILFIQGYWVA